MRQKPEEEREKNLFQKIVRPENCPGLSKITVNQVIWDRVSAEARIDDVTMQRVQSALVKGTTNVALIADLVLKSSEDKDNIDTTALLDKLWKLTEDSLCRLGAANWELVQRRQEALKPQISKDYICVLKKSNLLNLCLETMLSNKSKILQMIIKSLISCWTKIDRGTDPPMQTLALVGVVQVLEAHPFEDEVQPTNTAQQPTASQNTTRKHPRTNSGASGKYSFM